MFLYIELETKYLGQLKYRKLSRPGSDRWLTYRKVVIEATTAHFKHTSSTVLDKAGQSVKVIDGACSTKNAAMDNKQRNIINARVETGDHIVLIVADRDLAVSLFEVVRTKPDDDASKKSYEQPSNARGKVTVLTGN